ncbi:MAG: methyltransferase domain-containing protein [Thermoplasmata archaeon]|nr:methyltransferase domain-containing protein [Thermoplasmata archaeon]
MGDERAADCWAEGDAIALVGPGVSTRVTRLHRGPQKVGGDSVLDLTDQIGRPVGGVVTWLGATYRAVRPSVSDLLSQVRRGAQIVTAKDAAQLVLLAGVGPGGSVAEAGSGSGALTIVLATAVGPAGHVVSCDRRPEFLENARSNVARSGWGDRVEFVERDVAKDGWGRTGFTSVVLDLAEPWEVLAASRGALVTGGYVATYTPTYNQLERTVRRLRELGFAEVRATELIERGIHVGDGGTRPEFEMLGHTGFLAAGRKVD